MNQNSLTNVPRLALTPGEPAGIGPDLVIQLAQSPLAAELLVVADPDLLRTRAELLGLPLVTESITARSAVQTHRAGHLRVLPIPLVESVTPGHLNARNAAYVLDTLRAATALCQSGRCDALVTGPVQKSVINDAGFAFTGHTEFLAQLTGAGEPVMMLCSPTLRVALASTHLPLREVAGAITPARLEHVIRVLHRDLQDKFGIDEPRILVAGLNPHAGEDGHLGHEENRVINPVLERLRREGMQLTGPLPADTLFLPKYLQSADAVLAMYHDQGLPVLKSHGFGHIVNVTLGLPIIRTSVDHGTALDVAGTGHADAGSLNAAVAMALQLCARRSQP